LIQELVLVLDGSDGFGLALDLDGASLSFGPAGRSHTGSKQARSPPVEARIEGLSASKRGDRRTGITG